MYDNVIHKYEVISMRFLDVKVGMSVDYHGIIGGPATIQNCTVKSDPWQLGDGTWVVKISEISGGVDLAAITPSQR